MGQHVRFYLFILITTLLSCQQPKEQAAEMTGDLFTILGPEKTGVAFRNDLQETLYMNGLFYEYFYNGAGVAVGDFNNDQLPDIYFVSNLKANELYLNRGDLQFQEVGQAAGVAGKAGFPTGVATVDINGDGLLDIYICASGKFRDPERRRNELYINQGPDANGLPRFTEQAADYGLDLEELSTQAAFFDYDRDGDIDLVGGNLGLNYKYKASPAEPFEIYANDFDESGNIDIVLGYYNQGDLYPLRGRECSSNQMPFIKEKFPTYDAYGKATLEEVYEPEKLAQSIHYQAHNFGTTYFENLGNGAFTKKVLDNYAQFSSTNVIIVQDFNGDRHLDLLLAGNLYSSEVETARNDAGYGVYLEGNGRGEFTVKRPFESGLFLHGDIKAGALIQLANGERGIIFAANNDAVQLVKIVQPVL